jgi:hypothetical protein
VGFEIAAHAAYSLQWTCLLHIGFTTPFRMMDARNTIQKTSENLKKFNVASRAGDYESQELTSRPHRKTQDATM